MHTARRYLAVFIAALLGALPNAALAGTPVDQGAPGNQGPWKVTNAPGVPITVIITNAGHTDTATTEAALALTAAAPTLITDGAAQTNAVSIRISIDAPAANTINAAGKLDCYEYINSQWVRVPDLDLTFTTAGFRFYAFGDFAVDVPFGRIAYRPNGMTLTGGGTTVTVRYEVIT